MLWCLWLDSKEVLFVCLFVLILRILLIFSERGREGKREGEKHGKRERYPSVASHRCPVQGLNLQPRACALTGDGKGDLLLCGTTPNPLSHTSQGSKEVSIVPKLFFPYDFRLKS